MQEASFNGLLKTLFYIFVFYYIIKLLARLFLPVLAKKVVEKASEQFQKHQTQNNTTTTNQQVKTDKPRETKKVGEYIDYEEIE